MDYVAIYMERERRLRLPLHHLHAAVESDVADLMGAAGGGAAGNVDLRPVSYTHLYYMHRFPDTFFLPAITGWGSSKKRTAASD